MYCEKHYSTNKIELNWRICPRLEEALADVCQVCICRLPPLSSLTDISETPSWQ